MKNKIIFSIAGVVFLFVIYAFISGDTENRFARLGVSYFDGDYVITHYGMSGTNAWLVLKGKVTSEPDKGYYHTRVLTNAKKTAYLQLPMVNTVIEEYISVNQLTSQQIAILADRYGNELLTKNKLKANNSNLGIAQY